ncbi:conserved hypothetical protein [Burkholderiales bacterium 8X]|nr:conserved hypothetical protein [Burkholderiales bacterium 8X]
MTARLPANRWTTATATMSITARFANLAEGVEQLFANRFANRILHKAFFALAMALCLTWSLASALHIRSTSASSPAVSSRAASTSASALHEWPATWDGLPLRPLALSAVEQRFADRFPGSLARLTDGRETLVFRQVLEPTRMLHPAADCYRALGYRLQQQRLERDAAERLWHCFVAVDAAGRKLRVCERIVDAKGVAFTDTSAWYWAAASGRSAGPWQALTLARRIE